MRTFIAVTLIFSSFFVSVENSHAEVADSVYLNGKIYTVNDRQAWAEAVAIKDGKFIYVGDSKSATKYLESGAKPVDLNGKMVMPGIHDAHSHMIWGGLNKLFECRLPLAAKLDKLIEKLKDCAMDQESSDW